MTQDELKQFLKENLRIEIVSNDGSIYGSARIEVRLYLEDEEISRYDCSLPKDSDSNY